jgi:hypothetical protein
MRPAGDGRTRWQRRAREVIEDTLLDALVAAGRLAEARALLVHRLDRHPSRRDLRRVCELPRYWQPLPV